jgi:hypothetical protein
MTAWIGALMTPTARRVLVTAALAATLGTALGACGDTPRATQTTPTVTVTSTASATTPRSSEQTTGDTADPTTAAGSVHNASSCDPDGPSAATIARDEATIVQPRDNRWVPDPDVGRGGDFCGGLSWVAVQGANSHYPARSRQLLIYHDGTFQGTAIRCEAFRGQDVSSVSPDAFEVTYAFVDVSIPEQNRKQDPLGRATVTFRWNGSRVVMDGSLPYAFTKGQC